MIPIPTRFEKIITSFRMDAIVWQGMCCSASTSSGSRSLVQDCFQQKLEL